MKPSTSIHSICPARRTLLASTMVVLLGAATAFAQTSGAGSTSTTGSSGADTSRRTQSGSTSSTGTRSDTTGTTSTSRDTYGTTASTTTGRDKLSWGDRRFVTKAADGGRDEVQLAELAAQRATNPEVKSFAQKLVTDHTKVNSELMSLASQKTSR